jgi:ubiquinol-cytochrome c reductase iron-sulfur subunit
MARAKRYQARHQARLLLRIRLWCRGADRFWRTGNMAGQAVAEADAAIAAEPEVRRRDVINIAAVAFAGVGVVPILGVAINQMNPSSDILALATTEVDISKIEAGQAIKTIFQKQALFVRRLTADEIAQANQVSMSELRDPETLAQRTKPGKEEWLITSGNCTHLGCIPLGAAAGEIKGEYGGYFCPCHGSSYDTAARIRKGPAPKNLPVPDYVFRSDTLVEVGAKA